MISTRRRLQYASGHLELGMLAEAAAEMAAIAEPDRTTPEVISVQLDLHMQAKQWAAVIKLAPGYIRLKPEDEKGWISQAYALREQEQITEAQAVLWEAEARLGKTCGVLHYNLACYACLLGDRAEAKRRLKLALKLDKSWKSAALDDPDLKTMRHEIEEMK